MRIYIAGPMTDYPDWNFPAFNKAARQLRSTGYDAVNPAEINPDTTIPWVECLKLDLKELLTCEAIYMLKGWQASKGACLEFDVANRLEMKVYYE